MKFIKVLIVEDEMIISKHLEIRLRSMGYEVTGTVISGEEALVAVAETPPDVVLMDIMIAGEYDGIETAALIQAERQVPIIYLTAYADETTFERAKLSDPFGYILKPSQDRELDMTIQTVVRKHRLEQQLRESEQQYKLLFQDSPLPMWIYDVATLRFLAINQVACRSYGYSEEEFLQLDALSICPPEDQEAALKHLEDVRSRQVITDPGRTWRHLKKDGSVMYVESRSHAQTFDGRDARMVLVTDVTAKVLAEQALRENEIRYRTLFETTTEAIVIFNDDDQIMAANPAAAALYGQGADGLRGASFRLLFPDHGPADHAALRRNIRAQREYQTVFSFKDHDGDLQHVELRTQADYLEGLHLAAFRNVTREWRAEMAVNYQRDVLEFIAQGKNLSSVLEEICRRLEGIDREAMASVVRFQNGVVTATYSTQLPSAYTQALMGEPAGPKAGACGTAAYLGKRVICEDIATDPYWETYAPLALAHNLRACWSSPIHNSEGEVVATFAVYYPEPRGPSPFLLKLTDVACYLASIAIERQRNFESLRTQALTFENISDAVIITDPAAQILQWSPSAQRLFGYRQGEATGQTLDLLMPSAPHQVLSNGVRRNSELTFTTKAGREGVAETMTVPLRDDRGSAYGHLWVLREVTLQRQAEQARRIYEERFRKVFTANPTAMVIVDFVSNHVLDANESFGRLTARPATSYLDRPAYELPLCHDRALWDDTLARLRSGEKIYDLSLAFITEGGHLKHVTTSFERIQTADADLIVMMIHDVTEQRAAEEALRQSEAHFKSLIQQGTDLITVFDASGKPRYQSPSVRNNLGYTPEELMERDLLTLVSPDTHRRLRSVLEEVLTSAGRPIAFELEIRHKEGGWRHFEVKAHNLLHDPDVAGVVVNLRDVTDRRQVEQALTQSESRLKALFETTVQAFVLLDHDYVIQTFNKTARQMLYSLTGRTPTVEVSLLDYLDEEWRDGFRTSFRAARLGRYISFERSIDTPFGNKAWFEISFLPVYNDAGTITGVCFTALDIQDRKNTELALAESEARFRSLAQNASDIITVIDASGYVNYTSESTERSLGYDTTQLLSHRWANYIHPDDRERFVEMIDTLREQKRPPTVEYRFQRADGTYAVIESVVSDLLDIEAVSGIVLNSRDVTERRGNEENLRLLRRAIDTSQNGILITEAQGARQVIYANAVFADADADAGGGDLATLLRPFVQEKAWEGVMAQINRSLDQRRETKLLFSKTDSYQRKRWQEFYLTPVHNSYGATTHYIGVLNDVTDRKLAEDVLHNIVRSVSGSTGEQFFYSLVENLATYLSVHTSVIGEFVEAEGKTHVRTIARFRLGEHKDNITFDVPQDFTDRIIKEGFVHHRERDMSAPRMPGDTRMLMGSCLYDNQHRPVGVLYIAHKQSVFNEQIAESTLRLFSLRAAAELDRLATTRALSVSQANLSAVIGNTTDSVWAINRAYEVIVCNTVAARFFATPGGPEEPLRVGDDALAKAGPEVAFWQELYDRAFDGERLSIDLSVTNQTHEVAYSYEISFYPIVEQEEVMGVSVFAKDITKRKQAEDELRASEANLSALIENTDDIICSMDRNLRVMTSNAAFKRVIERGFGASIDVGDTLSEKLPEVYVNSWSRLYERAMAEGTLKKELHYDLQPDPVDLEVSLTPILTQEGEVNGLTVFGRDITQRKIWEDELRRTNFELDSFVYRASHDLRAPLRSLLGLVHISRIEEDADARLRYLALMEKSVNKLDSFIIDLTNFSRNSRLEIKRAPIDFQEMVDECTENLRYMDHAARIDANIVIEGETAFYSDPTRISVVMQNLISNAIKYQRLDVDRSWVEICVRIDPEAAEVMIEDNGKGIAPAHLKHIFEMFYRASEDSYGSGLGLYITKQVIEKLRGTIDVTSTPGQGTRFHIRIPNLPEEA
ncbi:MAG: PAS domain S-box protein [Catalinimonas sp.]